MTGRHGIVVAVALALGAGAALAHSGATGVVKQRMEGMKDMAAAMKMLGAMTRGNAPFDGAKAAAEAGSIADHAKHAPMQFPAGSFGAPSEARATIADNRDDFARKANDLGVAAMKMMAAANAGDRAALEAARRDAGRACSACHKAYREKRP
jgi:cytochrome c556